SEGSHCPRCRTPLHVRKPFSVSRTWSLLIAAAILYVPANLLPMLHTNSLFDSQSDTIMSGIVYFWHSGAWYLAIIIFSASILVPLLKMIALAWLLVSVQLRSRGQQEQRAPLPCRGSHRPLVDTRYLCRRDCRHAGAIWGARDHRARRWRGCVRRGGGAYHVRIDELRSAPGLGSFREKRWLTLHGDPTRSTFPRRLPHRNRAPGYSSYGWFHLSPY